MKANAPEKIYIHPDIGGREFLRPWLHRPANNESVEYVRTDAFIEKVCEYFRGGLEDTEVIDDYRNILVRGIQARYTSVEEFIEDFKKYIKGK